MIQGCSQPRPEYPRPEFRREDWLNLNGSWEFSFDDGDRGLDERWYSGKKLGGSIIVPFCYQCEASGIGLGDEKHAILWYAREFQVPDSFSSRRVLLRFGAVDYRCDVWVDGAYVGGHTGGYTPFGLDITDALGDAPEHRLYVRVEDSGSCVQPRGKQNWEDRPFGCWYTPVSGIWQTVWLEPVERLHIRRARITPDIDSRRVSFELYLSGNPEQARVRLAARREGGKGSMTLDCGCAPSGGGLVRLTLDMSTPDMVDEIHHWTPERPVLYDVDIELWRDGRRMDAVRTYFGMRKIDIHEGKIRLNNRPLYQKLLLDQGYWRETLLTPPSDEAIRKDIGLVKAMGFNGVRKHQKIEDPRFYYWADRMGLLVWGEVPSAYEFCAEEMENLYRTAGEFIERDYNHPCIVLWVPLNESWGVRDICADPEQQQFARGLCHFIKSLDRTRLVSGNDGWEQVETDLCAIHDYVAFADQMSPQYRDIAGISSANGARMLYADGCRYSGEPVLITEYGGIAFARDSGGGNWGYNGSVETEGEFLTRYADITDAFRRLSYVQGYCYTQLTDVFQEVNGLLNMDREAKVAVEKIREINR